MTSSPTSRFRIAKRRVLLLSSTGATLHAFSRGRVEEPLRFTGDEAGVGGFAEYLRLSEPDPVYLLVDVVEEDFRLDSVPHVFGRDRAAVLENKQARLFRDSRYTQAIFQGRETEGRKDDKVLFTSIIRPELLDPWLAQLDRLKVPIAGIYSLPVVSGQLIKRIPISSKNALLVTLQGRGALRQTFFDEGHLKVSRLASLPRLEASRMASYVLQEIERVRRYLNSLRLLNSAEPLQVYLLLHGTLLQDLERQAKDTVTTNFQLTEIGSLGEKLKLTGLTSGDLPYADRLFASLLALDAPANFYASARETRYHTLNKAGSLMKAVGALSLAGGVGWGIFEFAHGFDKQLEMSTLGKQASFYEDRYSRGRGRLPKLPADGNAIKQAVGMVRTIEAYRETPLALLVALSRGLDEFPEMKLRGLQWESGANPSEGAGRRPERSVRRGRGRTTKEKPEGYFQAANVQGRLEPFDGNFRLALERVNRFAALLGEVEGIETVTVLKRPLEVSSRERLSGVASSTSESGEALFELRLVLRTHGEPGRS